MCGICGEFSYSIKLQLELADYFVRLMSRRGPDDEGQYTDGKHCWLGFRRLSILDLSPAGHQPMITEDGRFAIVFNGEVYNFCELRKELEARGIRFRSSGDAEVVLYALAEWGKAALDRFNGMFALAFYDCTEKRLLLARDHAGIKPLYYLHTSKGVVFASQYDQILSHPWRQGLEVSRDALGLYLRFGYIPAPYALLERTAMLEPGCWMEFDLEGGSRHGVFFDFPQYQQSDLSGLQAYEAVDEAVTRAVARQMVSDVPVGAFLSGGIDSPLVAAKMHQSQADFKAFTIQVEDPCFDESEAARQYARQLDIPHRVEIFQPGMSLELLDDVISACSEPFADYSIFPTMFVTKLARQNMTVMLSGDGGDELFWGYAGRMGSAIRSAPLFRFPFILRKLRWWLLRRQGEWNTRYFATPGEYYQSRHMRNFEGFLAPIFPSLSPLPGNYRLFDYTGSDQDHMAQWIRWNEYHGHLTQVLMKVDRASMYNSLEVRVPLLDREVISTALRIDWRTCLDLDSGEGKIPLRWSLKRHVNRITPGKRGFSVPMSDWLRGPLKSAFVDLVLNRREILGLEIVPDAMRQQFHAHITGQFDRGWGLWVFLSLALWESKYY